MSSGRKQAPSGRLVPLTFGSREAAAQWAVRLEEIAQALADHKFALAAEDVEAAADWLAAYATGAGAA